MANDAEKSAVLKVVQDYIDGTYYGDTALLEGSFHDKAVMNGYLGPDLMIADPSGFIADIAGSPSMESNGDDYKSNIEECFVEGDIASVIISESGFRGSVSFIDCFHLIKADGKWSIISKLFTTR